MKFISRHVTALLGIALMVSLLAVVGLGLLLISNKAALTQSEAQVQRLETDLASSKKQTADWKSDAEELSNLIGEARFWALANMLTLLVGAEESIPLVSQAYFTGEPFDRQTFLVVELAKEMGDNLGIALIGSAPGSSLYSPFYSLTVRKGFTGTTTCSTLTKTR